MKMLNMVKGVSGLGLVQLTDIVPTGDNLTEIAKILIQIIIAVATLISLFKKKRK